MIRYRVDVSDDRIIIPVECAEAKPGTPDADGVQQYVNTHFDSIEDARAKARRESVAWATLTARELVQARNKVRQLEGDAARCCVVMARVEAICEGNRHTVLALKED